ncbi:hypothetical protein ACLVWQ_24665 [Streptomyces sp. CWNU-52B]|uniref:hypothetical protein n=1 Tax=unclassified Streptomyces TaxID=2593676 RepID=UPI0039C2656A
MTVPVSYARPDQLGDYQAHQLGRGGQGTVYRVPDPPGRFTGADIVYKEFHEPQKTDSDVLYDMLVFREELSRSHRHDWAFMDARLTWPLAMIYMGSRPTRLKPSLNSGMQVTGFLMPRIKPEYQISNAVLGCTKAQDMAFLLNEDAFTTRIGLPVGDEDRLGLLFDLAGLLTRLHRHGVIVGDLSPKNVLFTLVPKPNCLLIDCDSMRLRGRDVLAQVETDAWEVPEAAKATAASDSYKFGLIATRVFNRDQHSTDLSGLRAVSSGLANLAERARNTDPRSRPALEEWPRVLKQALAERKQKAPFGRPYVPPPGRPVGQQFPAPPPRPRPAAAAGRTTAPGSTPADAVPMPPAAPPAAPSAAPPSWGGRVLTVLLVIIVLAVVIGLLAAMTSDDSADGSSSVDSTVDSTVRSDTGTRGRATAPGASVDYSQVADEPEADEVATLFARFYGAVNQRNYDKAMTYYDPASNVVDTGSAASREGWTRSMRTTEESDIVLGALSVSGPHTLATVHFTSHQDAGYGPASNPDDTCDAWTVTYHLTRTKGYRILKAPAEGVSHTPC